MKNGKMESGSVQINKRIIPLSIIRSTRAKHISLRIAPAKNVLIITLPWHTPLASAIKFLKGKKEWVLENIKEYPQVRLAAGVTIPVLGKEYIIRRKGERGITTIDIRRMEITVHCAPEFTERRVRDFLRKRLHERCVKRSHAMAERIDKKVRRVTITKAQSNWGSCDGKARVSFSWLLVFAPTEILEYIIAHEVAHLKEMNHGPKFWALVKELCPGMNSAQRWLKEHGHTLHQYDEI